LSCEDQFRRSLVRSTILGVDRRASPQPTLAALPPYRLWQLQDSPDDNTSLRHRVRPFG